MKILSKKTILKKLKSIPDPELGINIVDLGLVYDVKIKNGQVKVLMTLTSMGCPLFPQISQEIEKRLKGLKEIKGVKIDLTFDPAWSPEKMSKEAKARLGFL